MDYPIIEVLAPANAYEPPQAEEIVLVDKMLSWTESSQAM